MTKHFVGVGQLIGVTTLIMFTYVFNQMSFHHPDGQMTARWWASKPRASFGAWRCHWHLSSWKTWGLSGWLGPCTNQRPCPWTTLWRLGSSKWNRVANKGTPIQSYTYYTFIHIYTLYILVYIFRITYMYTHMFTIIYDIMCIYIYILPAIHIYI